MNRLNPLLLVTPPPALRQRSVSNYTERHKFLRMVSS